MSVGKRSRVLLWLRLWLFALGEEDAAWEHIGQVMKHGIDPQPNQKLAESARYRELALANSIAVPVWD